MYGVVNGSAIVRLIDMDQLLQLLEPGWEQYPIQLSGWRCPMKNLTVWCGSFRSKCVLHTFYSQLSVLPFSCAQTNMSVQALQAFFVFFLNSVKPLIVPAPTVCHPTLLSWHQLPVPEVTDGTSGTRLKVILVDVESFSKARLTEAVPLTADIFLACSRKWWMHQAVWGKM